MVLANNSRLLKVLNLCLAWRAASQMGPHLIGTMLCQQKATTRELALFRKDSTCYSMVVQTMQRMVEDANAEADCTDENMTTWLLKHMPDVVLETEDRIRLSNLSIIAEQYDLRHVRYIAIVLILSMTSQPATQRAVSDISLGAGGPPLPNRFFRKLFDRTITMRNNGVPIIRPVAKGRYKLTVHGLEIADQIKTHVLAKSPQPITLR